MAFAKVPRRRPTARDRLFRLFGVNYDQPFSAPKPARPPATPHRRSRSRRARLLLLLLVAAVLAAGLAYEGVRVFRFYLDVAAARDGRLSLERNVELTSLPNSAAQVLANREQLSSARAYIAEARSFLEGDLLIRAARRLPWLSHQIAGADALILAADEAAATGRLASEVALAFANREEDPALTSIQEALVFLQSQRDAMTAVKVGLERLKQARAAVPTGLFGPLGAASTQLNDAVAKLDGLVTGYQRADRLLPGLLGYEGRKRFLVLPQNDTELFPSGGLISSYAIATFNEGRLERVDLEYFGVLFDRWQAQTAEYVAPPAPLKQYLKQDYSWGLGEAGWYPDFPTTAALARSFVSKGGAPPTDGTIAIYLQFIQNLLALLGPLEVPDFGVTVTADNVSDLTLKLTRGETYVPGRPRKAFLSFLSSAVIDQVFSAPKEKWVDLLALLDRMANERHLQVHFNDPELQALGVAYGLDGSIVETDADYLLVADTSVNSTKLNLILETNLAVIVQLNEDGSAATHLTYTLFNPFPKWRQGRDPGLVSALMLDGVYGSYLRVYTRPEARLVDMRLDGQTVGAEQAGPELGKQAFGRYFPVRPGESARFEVAYETPDVVEAAGGLFSYALYLQKEAGTAATPLSLRLSLPAGAELVEVRLDGEPVARKPALTTDLRTDRLVEVVFRR